MSIPDLDTVMLPILETLDDGKAWELRDIGRRLADKFRLSEDEREKPLRSGRQTVFYNRVGWATTYLKQAGLIESPSRGSFQISAEGRKVLAQKPTIIDTAFLKQFPGFEKFRSARRRHRLKKPPTTHFRKPTKET
jgi:restriction system protein